MIRMIGKRLLIPKGDTGIFSLPNKEFFYPEDVAIFSVRDKLTNTTVIEKYIDATAPYLVIDIKHEDTCNLSAGKYFWDIKIYRRPEYDEDGKIISAEEIDSYYSAYEQPLLIIKEVAKRYG